MNMLSPLVQNMQQMSYINKNKNTWQYLSILLNKNFIKKSVTLVWIYNNLSNNFISYLHQQPRPQGLNSLFISTFPIYLQCRGVKSVNRSTPHN
jgi:hypothetical protein